MAETTAPSELQDSETCETYPISEVAKLTGLSVHTIRAWEKRYGVVEPSRTARQRRVYTGEHVRKLRLLGRAVEAGKTISSIAQWTIPQLEQKVDSAGDQVPGHEPLCPPNCRCATFHRVGVVGHSLLALFDTQGALLPGMEVTRSWESLEMALLDAAPNAGLDLLLLESDTLFPVRLGRIRDFADRFPTARVVIIYRFAPQDVVLELNRAPRFLALRSPVNAEELRLAAWMPFQRTPQSPSRPTWSRSPAGSANTEPPARLFTPQQLARLSRMSGITPCECPQHLANLITSLAAFEAYTSECEVQSAGEDSLHEAIRRSTASARRQLEEALGKLLEAEQLRL